jgi:hypothetical protein
MMPNFFVRPDGHPDADWDDPSDPRFFLAHFIGSEVYLFLPNADEFLQAVAAVERGEVESWRWDGNSFSVELSKGRCVISHHWWEPGDPSFGVVELTLEEFRSLIAAWRDFVIAHQGPREGSPGVA